MSDLATQRNILRRLEQTQVGERPPLYLPWVQRALNPFPLASSGGGWGDSPQPWSVNLLAFYCSVVPLTTNNATNFWTIGLYDAATNTLLASLSTAAVAVGVEARLSTSSIIQPGTTNPGFYIIPTATLTPGAIVIIPSLAMLRTGN